MRLNIEQNKPLAKFTTLGVGGNAEYYCEVATSAHIEQAVVYARDMGLDLTCLGGGSNLLINDRGIKGLVMHIKPSFSNMIVDDNFVIVESGTRLSKLVEYVCKNGLLDLSCCAGIPGSCGGAVYMNAGTKIGEISDKIEWVEVFDIATGDFKTLDVSEMGFGYRYSTLHEEFGIVTKIAFKRESGDPGKWWNTARDHLEYRVKSQPHGVKGWAGSFFRNPPGQFAGLLIDKTGLKGLKIGGAEVSAVHANFLINSGGAAADDFIALIKKVKQSVREQFNVELKLEVKLAGFTEEEKKEL